MKKLFLILLFVSAMAFGQEKTLFKAISYTNLIELYNQKLELKNEDLKANIERCRYIIADAQKKQDHNTELAFKVFLTGLQEANAAADKSAAFISVYQDPTSYSFYDSKNKFIARVDKHKFDEQLTINGDNTETYVSNYFYMLQE